MVRKPLHQATSEDPLLNLVKPSVISAELPVAGGHRGERADGARNREAILRAARRLLRDRGADAITMDALAAEAGVGKGTLFRRFGDRARLFHALLDETEAQFQEAFIRGAPPLGPGATPLTRLIAFGHEVLELTPSRGDLLLAARPADPEARFWAPPYLVHRAHLVYLLGQLEVPLTAYFGDVLLAALAPDVVLHQLARGTTLEQLKTGWSLCVTRLTS